MKKILRLLFVACLLTNCSMLSLILKPKIGMTQRIVKDRFGDPSSIDKFFDETGRIETWRYAPRGFSSKQRSLRFENGVLVEWAEY